MTVRILYHEEPDGWWAESPDIAGWSAAGANYDEVHELAEEGVQLVLDGPVDIEHYRLVDHAVA